MRVIAFLWTVAASITVAAVEFGLDPQTLDAAIRLGQSSAERDRVRYHSAYRFEVNTAPLDYIDIVTPFRRVVLGAETRARIGDRMFGQRQALELLAGKSRQIDIHAEFTFHPQNTFVGVPDYAIRLEQSTSAKATVAIAPRSIERVPRFGARVDRSPLFLPVPGGVAPGKSQPMLGGTVIAQFDGESLNAMGAYDVAVLEEEKELGRVRVNFATLR